MLLVRFPVVRTIPSWLVGFFCQATCSFKFRKLILPPSFLSSVGLASAGGNCTGGITAPVAAPGWYPSAAAAFEFYECPRPEDCLGGDPPQCAEGTTGVQCASCDERWYKLNGECRPCKVCHRCKRGARFLFSL